MIVHRILDAVFRTLDTVDAIRARVDSALGRAEAQPPSQWPAVIEDDRSSLDGAIDGKDVRAAYAPTDLDAWKQRDDGATPTPAPSQKATSSSSNAVIAETGEMPVAKKTAAPHKRTPSKAARVADTLLPQKAATTKKAAPSTTKKAAAKKATKKTAAATTNRKGSIDRQGRDLDSPRANDVAAWIASTGAAAVSEDADLDGKRTLARVLWAVAMAEQAGITDGLTSADASALLSAAANLEVFSTNVARAFRDENALFVETSPDGRSKRYTLTAAGRARLVEVVTR